MKDFDEFLDEREYTETKDKIHDLMITKLKEKIETGKNDALNALKDAWQGDDYEAYASLVEATVQKCCAALDKLGTDIDGFIDEQINVWHEKEQNRINQINDLK